jgi:hypothetical protein
MALAVFGAVSKIPNLHKRRLCGANLAEGWQEDCRLRGWYCEENSNEIARFLDSCYFNGKPYFGAGERCKAEIVSGGLRQYEVRDTSSPRNRCVGSAEPKGRLRARANRGQPQRDGPTFTTFGKGLAK